MILINFFFKCFAIALNKVKKNPIKIKLQNNEHGFSVVDTRAFRNLSNNIYNRKRREYNIIYCDYA